MTTVDETKDVHPRVAEALAAIEAGVKELRSSEDWVRWLRFSTMFHAYSFNNIMLIMGQRPDATQCAGMTAWNKMGRRIRRGERGITILAPTLRTMTTEDKDTGEEIKVRRLVGFHVARTFDVSQTYGMPLPDVPGIALPTGDAPSHAVRAVREYLVGQGWEVALGDFDGEWNGRTDVSTRRVEIQYNRSQASRFKTLVHEAAHVLLHAPTATSGVFMHERTIGEVEAESVAFIVCSAVGVDTGSYSFGYVNHWLADQDPSAIRDVADRITTCAQRLLKVIGAPLAAPTDRE